MITIVDKNCLLNGTSRAEHHCDDLFGCHHSLNIHILWASIHNTTSCCAANIGRIHKHLGINERFGHLIHQLLVHQLRVCWNIILLAGINTDTTNSIHVSTHQRLKSSETPRRSVIRRTMQDCYHHTCALDSTGTSVTTLHPSRMATLFWKALINISLLTSKSWLAQQHQHYCQHQAQGLLTSSCRHLSFTVRTTSR